MKRGTANNGSYPHVVVSNATSLNDTSLANGTTYYYVVSAVNAAGESANSTQVSATPVAPVTIPPAPTNLTAVAGNTQVSLTWSASAGATSYMVKRSIVNGSLYSTVNTTTSTSYTDVSLMNGLPYYYVVTALNSAGESTNSTQVTVSPTATIAVTGLHVSGNKILNGQNQQVALRGVNKQGTEYQCLYSAAVFDGPSDANSVTVLKTWNINIVRLPINEHCWLGINGVPAGGATASDYRTAIVNYVNLLNAGNIAVIIDLQWAAPGTNIANSLIPMPDADHASAFWTSVANTFKTNSSVIFDLFNEPYPDFPTDGTASWTCLRDGGTCPGLSYTAVGTQSLVNTIRATGSTNIIMVPGIALTNVLDQWLIYKPTDSAGQLAASWHSYAGQICANPDPEHPDSNHCWTRVIQPIAASVPLIVGEIGENDCATTHIDPLMTFLDSIGAHYLAWAWNAYPGDPNACAKTPSLISDYNGTPTAFGLGFRDHLLGL